MDRGRTRGLFEKMLEQNRKCRCGGEVGKRRGEQGEMAGKWGQAFGTGQGGTVGEAGCLGRMEHRRAAAAHMQQH